MKKYCCSTPSRLCLFGEHQDYLHMEVIGAGINLRFSAEASKRNDGMVHIMIRDSHICELNQKNDEGLYQYYSFDLKQPIVYEKKRDYLRSTFSVLLKEGYDVACGFDVKMDSEIPIGKGMCSSSTMIVVLLKTILETIQHPDKDNPDRVAYLGYLAEVAEFNEPGGMQDHFTSAYGGLVHLSFDGEPKATALHTEIPGVFILFDSLQQKDTIKVLNDSKIPVQEAIEMLKPYGIQHTKEIYQNDENLHLADKLDDFHKNKLLTSIQVHKLVRKAFAMIESGNVDPVEFGNMLNAHHVLLREGLNVSTQIIDHILDVAMENGALGGKINGSGGGGCLFVYAMEEDAPKILAAVEREGYPGVILQTDAGVKLDKIIEA